VRCLRAYKVTDAVIRADLAGAETSGQSRYRLSRKGARGVLQEASGRGGWPGPFDIAVSGLTVLLGGRCRPCVQEEREEVGRASCKTARFSVVVLSLGAHQGDSAKACRYY
jgi:hypothetical protein